MSDLRAALEQMKISQADHLPLVAAFLNRMGVASVINRAVPTEMAVDVGSVVKLMVLDTLSGRSPLYRLEDFASSVDIDLLLGVEVDPSSLNDTTVGRPLDAIYASGTEQLFSQVALSAASSFPQDVDLRHVAWKWPSCWGFMRERGGYLLNSYVWGPLSLADNSQKTHKRIPEKALERLAPKGYSCHFSLQPHPDSPLA